MIRDYRLKAGSIELQVREYEHDGSPVIFLHYGGGNLMMWPRAAPYFQARRRIILVDLRDHGKSDRPQMEAHIAFTSEFGPYSTWKESEAAFREHVEKTLAGMGDRPVRVFSSLSAFVAASRESLEKYGLWNEYMEAEEMYAMQSLSLLARRGKITTIPGWVHPYGWLLDPEAMCRTVLEFLDETGAN